MSKPIYKLVDQKGRVYIPKNLRAGLEMDCGDIVKLGTNNGRLNVERVHIVEAGDKSPEALFAFVKASIKYMPNSTKVALIKQLIEQITSEKEV